MAIGTFRLPVSAGGSAPETGFTVLFYDPFGELIKKEVVAEGGNATAPTPPTISGMTFAHWNQSYTNIQRNKQIGAIYDTTDEKTYIFIHVNSKTGLQPTIFLQKSTTDQITIDWGHNSETSQTTNSGNYSVQKPTAYTEGWYVITLSCAGGYKIGQGTTNTTIFGSYGSNAYLSAPYKVLMGATCGLNAYAFYNCICLQYISFCSDYSGALPAYLFRNCYALIAVHYPTGVTGDIPTYLHNYNRSLSLVTFPNEMSGSIGTYCFTHCNSLHELTLPASLTGSIGNYAFQYAHALNSLVIPDGVMGSIGTSAFEGCHALLSLELPSGMTGSIGGNCFYTNYSLEELILPSAMTGFISGQTFYNMFSLKSLTVPSGITDIGTSAFVNMVSIREIIFQSTTPPTLTAGAFGTLLLICRLYVPDANVNDYKSATNWTDYADYIYSINDRP